MGSMPDEPQPPTSPLLPEQPDLFSIPTQLIEQWLKIPSAERVSLDLTRQDVDHLILGLLRICEAQSKIEAALVEWSHGRIDQANVALHEFRRFNIESQNNIRQLVTAIMASALRGPP